MFAGSVIDRQRQEQSCRASRRHSALCTACKYHGKNAIWQCGHRCEIIVLLIASKHGIAVYNLDDQHRDAVRVHAGGRTLTLSPSNQAVITSKQNTAFEQVNPLETMAYRRVTDFEIGANLRAFNSEFSMLSAISTIKPLKSIVSSKHPEARRISAHLLKTAAAMVQLKAGLESYQKVPHSRLSAFLSQN